MSGKAIDFDLYNLCSMESSPTMTPYDVPSSPIHELLQPKKFFSDDSKYYE